QFTSVASIWNAAWCIVQTELRKHLRRYGDHRGLGSCLERAIFQNGLCFGSQTRNTIDQIYVVAQDVTRFVARQQTAVDLDDTKVGHDVDLCSSGDRPDIECSRAEQRMSCGCN